MYPLEDIRKTIESDLERFDSFYKESVKSSNLLLNRIMIYTLKHKGKQIRPMLVLLSARLWGDVNESTLRAATFIELLHNATLIHDDVVDNAKKRRGFLSVNAIWKNKIAVLAGDYLLAKGMMIALNHNDFDMLNMISETVRMMSEGEIVQMDIARRLNVTEEKYYEIIEKKTASLTASCCAIGTASTNAPHDKIQKMKRFGHYAGMAFQIRDDVFDYQPDNKSGKDYGNDLKEHVLTLPLIHLLDKSSPLERKKIIWQIRHRNNDKKTRQYIIDKVHDNGCIKYAEDKMNEFIRLAMNELQDVQDSIYKETLITLLMYCAKRDM